MKFLLAFFILYFYFKMFLKGFLHEKQKFVDPFNIVSKNIPTGSFYSVLIQTFSCAHIIQQLSCYHLSKECCFLSRNIGKFESLGTRLLVWCDVMSSSYIWMLHRKEVNRSAALVLVKLLLEIWYCYYDLLPSIRMFQQKKWKFIISCLS